ncbi:hypothetical protein [Lacipirellula parvula]|uniref:PEP-CTERM protein-sorting domain-containing protein n=1 Tax=Lacipirellula parvula TaxID=2650471 RepID=A0A5K7XE36_9BACT|nr:hypothetical protein [Lacipirellula parvula]BBO34748.1 hypothetical protein PLANPX_4360 [Lacipirellula parvula]
MKLKLALFLALLLWQCSLSKAATVYSALTASQHWVVGSAVWWDDAQIVGGGTLSRFRFYGQQNIVGSRSYTTSIEFHLFDGATGLPNGPSLGRIQVSSSTPMPHGEVKLIESVDLRPLNIRLPPNSKLGVAFHQEHNIEVVLFGNPSIGASGSNLWIGSPPVARQVLGVRNNIGFEIEVVPEPHSWALVVAAVAGLAMPIRLSSRLLPR